jgi:hypothetical protein
VVNQTISEDSVVQDVLVQLLQDNSNGLTYAEWIQSHNKFRRIYQKLIKVDQACSQSAFEESVDEIRA